MNAQESSWLTISGLNANTFLALARTLKMPLKELTYTIILIFTNIWVKLNW